MCANLQVRTFDQITQFGRRPRRYLLQLGLVSICLYIQFLRHKSRRTSEFSSQTEYKLDLRFLSQTMRRIDGKKETHVASSK